MESSGHSGEVRKLLLLDNKQGDEGRKGAKTQTASDYSQIKRGLGEQGFPPMGILMKKFILTVAAYILFVFHFKLR